MFEAGVVLGARYRLEREIGRGGMGSVWQATRLDLGTDLAIKVMHGEASKKPGSLERFTREARAAASLTSPHVVRIIDFGVDAAGTAFMAMELLEGENLAARLASGARQPAASVASIINQVARALAQAHAAGIVHRDLKPANIFLVRNADDELVKLLDFGIAKAGDGFGTATGSVLGTPYYMSPEQVNSLKDIDHRTDLWSLGVIACECLTGRRPFRAETLSELAMKIALGRAEAPSSLGPVPAGFDEWFGRATDVDRERRFQSAGELAGALNTIAGQAAVAAPPELGLGLAATVSSLASSATSASGATGQGPSAIGLLPPASAPAAALATTSAGASVPNRLRENRGSSRFRPMFWAAAVLGAGVIGASYGGLFANVPGAAVESSGENAAGAVSEPRAADLALPPVSAQAHGGTLTLPEAGASRSQTAPNPVMLADPTRPPTPREAPARAKQSAQRLALPGAKTRKSTPAARRAGRASQTASTLDPYDLQ